MPSDRDTSADAARVQIEVLRRLGPERRGQLALAMSDDARSLILARIDREQPGLCPRDRTKALVAFLYGDELAAKAFAR